MISILEKNLNALESRFPGFTNAVFQDISSPVLFEIENTRTHELTLKYKGIYINSRYDPLHECEVFIEHEINQDVSCIVVCGFGLGYSTEAVIKKRPEAKIIIVEADTKFFYDVLSLRNFESIFLNDNVSILPKASGSTLFCAFEELEVDSVALYLSKPFLTLFPDYYKEIEIWAGKWISKKIINEQTLKRFGKLWVRNLARNLYDLGTKKGIASLYNIFSGIPALVLAAGPSLDMLVPHLHEIKKRCVLIVVDTALRACTHVGIKPDFLIVVDPQYWNARHLDRLPTEGIVLITESAVYPSVLREKFASIYFCSSLFPLGLYIEERSVVKGKLGAGGSVSTSAWDFARLLNASIIFMGALDLSFPEGKTHAKGSYFEERAVIKGKRFMPSETLGFLALHDACPYPVHSNDNEMVLSDKRMVLYSWWFENRMIIHPKPQTKNLSYHGIKITGMEYSKIDEILSYPERRTEIDAIMEKIISDGNKGEEVEKHEIAVASLIHDLKSISIIAQKGITLVQKALLSKQKGNEKSKILDDLDKLDAQLHSNKSKEVVGFLFPNLKDFFKSEITTLDDALQNSKAIYTEIKTQADFHISLLC